MVSLKNLILNLLFGDSLENTKSDYYILLSRVNHRKNETDKLIRETTDHIKKLKEKKTNLDTIDLDNFEINHQIIRLQSRIEELKQQLKDLDLIKEKLNTALLEDKIQASALDHYQIELELTKIR